MLTRRLKQRMLGALVLLAAAVVFLPTLFTRENRPRAVTVDAPAAPVQPVVTMSKAEPIATPEPSAEAIAPQSRLDPNGLPIAWSVQIANLINAAQAQDLQDRLRQQGYNAYIREFNNASVVFVGPILNESDAKHVAATLARQWQVSPSVVRFQP